MTRKNKHKARIAMHSTNTTHTYTPKPRPVATFHPSTVNTKDEAVLDLFQMHTYCRPAGSAAETAFCKRYLDGLPGMTIDEKGNRILYIPNGDGTRSRVLWSSHTDTVHSAKDGPSQKLTYGGGILSLGQSATSACLGADCTAGVWLMREMILREVPGLYIFHAAEEVGGIGSAHIATKTPELLEDIDYAIAFDRRGTTSVITHQGARCASDAFGLALVAQLSSKTHSYQLDTGGTFTDTANYTDLIPECTNISVGYYNAHTSAEYLDVTFLVHLLEKLCTLDLTTLPVERKAGEYDYKYASRFDRFDNYPYTSSNVTDTMEDLVFNNSYAVAQMLEELGVTVDEVAAYIAHTNTH